MNITSVLLCSNWKKRLDTSAVLASGYNEKGKTFKNRSKSVNVQCQIIKVFSVQTIMHIEHNKGLTNYSKVVKYSQKYPICCQAAFNSQLLPTQRKHTHVCANSPHLVILQLLSARCRFSTLKGPLLGCMKQQSPTPLSPQAQVRQIQALFSGSFCWRAQGGLNHKSNISQHC